MLLTGNNLVILNDVVRTGKNGMYRIVTLGCPESFTKLDLFVPDGVVMNSKVRDRVTVELDLEQRGYDLRATLRGIGPDKGN